MTLKSGRCPKCEETKVRKQQAGPDDFLRTGLTLLSHVPIDYYVCSVCGYYEKYVAASHLKSIEKKWEKVPPPGEEE